MSKSTRRRQLDEATRSLREATGLLTRAETHWEDLAPGMRAQPLEADRTSGHTTVTDEHGNPVPAVSDPTGEAAIQPNPTRAAETAIDRQIASLHRLALALLLDLDRWAIKPAVSARELADLERQADPGCEVVARVIRDDGSAFWEPEQATSDFRGLLDRKHRLGAWAYKFVQRNGRLPTYKETADHCHGRRVRVAS